MRVENASAHLFEHGDFTVRPEALVGVANLDDIDVPAWRFLCSACKCTCTSLQLKETRWTGDTNVDIGRAGCRLLGRLQQCLPRSDVSFEFGLARARAKQRCPQHREHLLSSRRNSDGPRFHIWHTGSSEFLFRVWSTPERLDPFSLRGLDHSDRWVDCDAVTRVSNASYHMAIVAAGALLDSELSEQSSSMGQGFLFPTAFGRTSNHTSSDPDMM